MQLPSRTLITLTILLFVAQFLFSTSTLRTLAQSEQKAEQTAQTSVKLEAGKSIERELKGGESHKYEVSLQAGEYFHLQVEQRGIDLSIVINNQVGKQDDTVNFADGTAGIETLYWISKQNHSYKVEVKGTQQQNVAGRYQLKMIELRAATQQDEAQIKGKRAKWCG